MSLSCKCSDHWIYCSRLSIGVQMLVHMVRPCEDYQRSQRCRPGPYWSSLVVIRCGEREFDGNSTMTLLINFQCILWSPPFSYQISNCLHFLYNFGTICRTARLRAWIIMNRMVGYCFLTGQRTPLSPGQSVANLSLICIGLATLRCSGCPLGLEFESAGAGGTCMQSWGKQDASDRGRFTGAAASCTLQWCIGGRERSEMVYLERRKEYRMWRPSLPGMPENVPCIRWIT